MLYGYGTFEMNRENDPQFVPEPILSASGVGRIYCTGGGAFFSYPDPPWWVAYQRTIAQHRVERLCWSDACFKYGYEAGLSDANDEIGRLKRQLADLEKVRKRASELAYLIDLVKSILSDEDEPDYSDCGDDE